MTTPKIIANDPVLLVGGGAVEPDQVAAVRPLCNRVVAADGGADTALRFGMRPDAVYGDFDSISQQAVQQIPQERLHRIAEQDTTDFDKALRHIDAPLVLGVGFSGARLDHALAALTVLATYPTRRVVLVGAEDVTFLLPPTLDLNLNAGSVLSLYPLGAVRIESQGLTWPTEGLEFAPDGRVGTSNAVSGPVTLRPSAPKMLCILPHAALPEVARALGAAPAQWA